MLDMPCPCFRSVIIALIAKSVNCLTYILFSTSVTSKEINQAFLIAAKFMINFVSFFCNCIGKIVCLIIYAQIWQRDLLQLKDFTDLSAGYNLALTK